MGELFTASSNWCASTGNVAGNWVTVFNAIEFNKYTLKTDVKWEAPLIFLSRIEKLKGAHEAISVAKATNNKLIIAGNISPLKEEQEYFKKEVEPFIDGEQIVFAGTLNDTEKNNYLGKAKAMLFPARTEEAFGMVMVEAMACGTPVIAYNHSAMPEVIIDGVTGFIVDNMQEMIATIDNISLLKREEVRNMAEIKFDVKVITEKYLSLLKKLND